MAGHERGRHPRCAVRVPLSGRDSWQGRRVSAAADQIVVGFDHRLPESARLALVRKCGGTILQRFDTLHAFVIGVPPGVTLEELIARFARESGVRYAEPDLAAQLEVFAIPSDSYYQGSKT